MFSRLLLWARTQISALSLFIGAILLGSFVMLSYWSLVIPISGIVVGGLVSLLLPLSRRISRNDKEEMQSELNYRIPIILACGYIVTTVLIFRFYSFQRPFIHYATFAAYTGFVGYEAWTTTSRSRVVPQISVLGFFTYWSSQLMFPAGSMAPDVKGEAIPIISTQLAESTPSFELMYQSVGALNFSFVTSLTLIGDISVFNAYALLATLVLTSTIPLITVIPHALPVINKRIAVFAALLFTVNGWMLGRGMHPMKLNFFYPMLLLLAISVYMLFDTTNRRSDRRWLIIGLLISAVLIFGHRYSAGAGMFLLFSISVFAFATKTIISNEYNQLISTGGIALMIAYILGIIGNPLHQEPLLRRLVGTLVSVLLPSENSMGGPGRYSELQFDVLLWSTAAQAILFALVIIGVCWAFKRESWEYDSVILWMVVISGFLVLGLTQNSAATQPQRFYSLLVLFGFNVFGAVGLVFGLGNSKFDNTGTIIVALVIVFASLSLASPVASQSTSVVSDEVPHNHWFKTYPTEALNDWGSTRVPDGLTDPPVVQTSNTEGRLNTSAIESDRTYYYTDLMSSEGIFAADSTLLGGRLWVFLDPPIRQNKSVIYDNGKGYIWRKQIDA